MKKFLTLIILFIAIPLPANAASYIQISDVAHRQMDGKFINDDLATSLAPDGKLGQLIYWAQTHLGANSCRKIKMGITPFFLMGMTCESAKVKKTSL